VTLVTAALCGRLASRGSTLFADKVQSAQRLEFGGHVERREPPRAARPDRCWCCSAPPATSPGKMLFPALYRLSERGQLTVPVVGVALTDLDTDRLRRHVAASVRPRSAPGSIGAWVPARSDPPGGRRLRRRGHLRPAAKLLDELVGAHGLAVRYLAVPPGRR
jgi:hypothetical protein